MSETKNAKYAYTTMYGLKQEQMLTDEEIARGIETGVIKPVKRNGYQIYGYNLEEIRQL